jgi:hypothetical protein
LSQPGLTIFELVTYFEVTSLTVYSSVRHSHIGYNSRYLLLQDLQSKSR